MSNPQTYSRSSMAIELPVLASCRKTVKNESIPPEKNAAVFEDRSALLGSTVFASIGTICKCGYHDFHICINLLIFCNNTPSTGKEMRNGSPRVTANGIKHVSHGFPELLRYSAYFSSISYQYSS